MPTGKRKTQQKISSFATVFDGGNTNKRKRGTQNEVGFGVAKARVSTSAAGNRSLVRSRHDATMYYALKQFWGYDCFRFQQQQIIVLWLCNLYSILLSPGWVGGPPRNHADDRVGSVVCNTGFAIEKVG